MSPSGISQWHRTTDYPNATSSLSCFSIGGSIFCTGGAVTPAANVSISSTAASYTASLSPSGVGNWSPVPSYPYPASGMSCVPYGSSAYCIGGSLHAVGLYSPIDTNMSVVYHAINPSIPQTSSPTTMQVQTPNVTSSQPPTPPPPQETSGNSYLLLIVIVVLVALMILALYLFNRKSSPQSQDPQH